MLYAMWLRCPRARRSQRFAGTLPPAGPRRTGLGWRGGKTPVQPQPAAAAPAAERRSMRRYIHGRAEHDALPAPPGSQAEGQDVSVTTRSGAIFAEPGEP